VHAALVQLAVPATDGVDAPVEPERVVSGELNASASTSGAAWRVAPNALPNAHRTGFQRRRSGAESAPGDR
jgi:hypothetical protein